MRLTIRAAAGALALLALGSRGAAGDYPTYHNVPTQAGCTTGSCGTPTRTVGSAVHGRVAAVIDKRYGNPHDKCCKPKLSPGACFGHYQTSWTPWAAVCPTASEVAIPATAAPPAPPVAPAPLPVTPSPMKDVTPVPAPAPKDVTPVPPATPKVPATDAPKSPTTPKGSAPEAPGKLDERGLILPPVPEIPVVAPSRF
jgi:hypothetical protein